MQASSRDLTRNVLAVLFLGLLIGMSLWILWPFLGAGVWATMIVVATWPILLALQTSLWGKRALAVMVMTLVLLFVLLVPLWLVIGTALEHVDQIVSLAKLLTEFKLPPPPEWLANLPLIGSAAVEAWQRIAAAGVENLAAKAGPYAAMAIKWFAAQLGSIGMLLVQSLLTVVIAAVMYAYGESAAEGVLRFGRRLAGDRGETAVRLAGQAIRGVALGVVVTALVQSVLGGIGLAVAGVPYALPLSAVMFVFAVAQIGVVPVLLVPVIWLFWTGDTGWGSFLLVWTVAVGVLDNVLRPILIKRGADMPLLLVFTGVIGGLISFGLIGIFIGPVVLAVAYTLLVAWVNDEPKAALSRSRKR
jgi:predicted PurR-regulated permease PerM